MDESFDAVCELMFTDAQSGDSVTVRLGAPTFDPSQDWFCLTEIIGAEEGGVQRLYGVDPFQALSLSLQRFRLVLAKLPGDFRTTTGDPPRIVFPRDVPSVYGSDVYGRLCELVDRAVDKIEDERARLQKKKKP